MSHENYQDFFTKRNLQLVQSTVENTAAVSKLLEQSWLDSYVGVQPGITREWVLELHKRNHMSEDIKEAEQAYKKFAEDPDTYLSLQVVDQNGNAVGMINANKENDQQELAGLYVSKEMKGTGLADELMERFYRWCDRSKDTILWVIDGNRRAIAFYERHGFNTINGSQKPHREGSPLTIVKMIKKGAK